jgi:hypothetical protein
MRISKDDIPVRLEAPGAIARQLPDFGEPDAVLGAEYFSLGAGTDLAPLFVGLDEDACQAPHWGFMIEGTVVITYTDGTVDRCRTGDLVHWPSGHSVRVDEDAEIILFSPQVSHGAVLDHLAGRLSEA